MTWRSLKKSSSALWQPDKRIVSELGIAGIKHACDFNGYYGGRGRAPLLPLTSEERAEVECLLAEVRN